MPWQATSEGLAMHAIASHEQRTCHMRCSKLQVKDLPHTPWQAMSKGLTMHAMVSHE